MVPIYHFIFFYYYLFLYYLLHTQSYLVDKCAIIIIIFLKIYFYLKCMIHYLTVATEEKLYLPYLKKNPQHRKIPNPKLIFLLFFHLQLHPLQEFLLILFLLLKSWDNSIDNCSYDPPFIIFIFSFQDQEEMLLSLKIHG